MTDDQLQFIDYRKPILEAGDYPFTVTHQYGYPDTSTEQETFVKTSKINMRVVSERVAIDAADIFAQYPPAGESGDFSDVLPHISFKKGALPWCRSAYDVDDNGENDNLEPWLYLLGINALDIENGLAKFGESHTFDQLDQGAYFPADQKDSLLLDATIADENKTVKTVDIKKSLFKKLFCSEGENFSNKEHIEYLAHIRRRWQAEDAEGQVMEKVVSKAVVTALNDKLLVDGDIDVRDLLSLMPTAKQVSVVKEGTWLVMDSQAGDVLLDRVGEDSASGTVTLRKSTLTRELSVLVANRLAQSDAVKFSEGTRNYSLVISLEQYLNAKSLDAINALGDEEYLRFIVLSDWWYNCTSSAVNFKTRLEKMDVDTLRFPEDKRAAAEANSALHSRLNAGFVALPHEFRQGAQSLSWYRGPFVPFDVSTNTQTIELTPLQRGQSDDSALVATDADRLLAFDQQDGMFDISYAAAYELGRILSFKNTHFTRLLSQYKRAQARYIQLEKKDAERKADVSDLGISIENLPYAYLTSDILDQQREEINAWLLQLAQFKLLPLWNLIADKQLLPKGAIRTFSIDRKWIQSLWLGALSLNGRTQVTYDLFEQCYQELADQIPRYGALLRSDVIWAYPELVTEFKQREVGDDVELVPSCKASMHKVSIDTCLYLTQEPFNYLALSLPPESLHYGISIDPKTQDCSKNISYAGQTIHTLEFNLSDVDLGIVSATALAGGIAVGIEETVGAAAVSNFKSARFGRYMLKGEPKAEFVLD